MSRSPQRQASCSAETVPGLVSVVIPTYNRSALLPAGIGSCFRQTYPHVEVVVVDDGSTDDTPEILASLQAEYGGEQLRYVRQENAGPAAARNMGMELARGEFLQFLDSDDFLDPTKFETQVDALRQNPDAGVAVCDYQSVYGNCLAEPFEKVSNGGDLRARLARFWKGSIWTATPLIRRACIPAKLRWNGAVVPADDVDFMFRLFLTLDTWCHTPGYLCTWVHHEGDRLITRVPASDLLYFELVRSVQAYWREARRSAPPANRRFVAEWVGAILGRRLRYCRDSGLLRQAASLAARRPWHRRTLLLAARFATKSLLPCFVLDLVAKARKRLGGTPPESSSEDGLR